MPSETEPRESHVVDSRMRRPIRRREPPPAPQIRGPARLALCRPLACPGEPWLPRTRCSPAPRRTRTNDVLGAFGDSVRHGLCGGTTRALAERGGVQPAVGPHGSGPVSRLCRAARPGAGASQPAAQCLALHASRGRGRDPPRPPPLRQPIRAKARSRHGSRPCCPRPKSSLLRTAGVGVETRPVRPRATTERTSCGL